MPDNGYQTAVHGVPGGAYLVLGTDENGLPCILTAGAATDDAGIVAAIGVDTLWADGSIYVSVVDAAGKLFLKTNDVWIDQK
jgi:hypothetical protein